MSIDLEKYNKIKAAADAKRKEVDQAEGALRQQMSDLKEKFGCETIEQAEAKLAELDEQLAAAEKTYNEELAAFEAKWGDLVK